METIVSALLSALIAAAPGLLALLSGKASDDEAREHALALLGSLRLIDVDGIIARERRSASVAAPAAPVAATLPSIELHDRAILRRILASGVPLSHEERDALSRVVERGA